MIRLFVAISTLVLLGGCGSRPSWKLGDVYSVKAGEAGGFMICKVLAVDDDLVWLSVFTEKFDQRPSESQMHGLSKWAIIWSTYERMKKDEPLLMTKLAPTTEELGGLQKAKTMFHRK